MYNRCMKWALKPHTAIFLAIIVGLSILMYMQTMNLPMSKMPGNAFTTHVSYSSPLTLQYRHSFQEAKFDCHNKSSVLISQLERPYRMFVYPQGHDVWISDAAYKSDGKPEGLFEYSIHQNMTDALAGHPDAIIYDIGANIGTHSVLFAAQGYEVHSFEPLKTNFELLECSAIINQFDPARFRVNNYGLSTQESSSCMSVSVNNMGGAWLDSQVQCDNPVALKRLDEYLERVNRPPFLIKIDVEGNEYNALLPAKEYLRKHKPSHIFSEFSARMLRDTGKSDPILFLELLWELGYVIKNEHRVVDKEFGNRMAQDMQNIYDIHAYIPA